MLSALRSQEERKVIAATAHLFGVVRQRLSVHLAPPAGVADDTKIAAEVCMAGNGGGGS